MWKTRLWGVLVALGISAAIAGVLTGLGADQSPSSLWAGWAQLLLPAGLAAFMLSTRVTGRWPDGVGDVFAMACVTYLIALLIYPLVIAVAAWPSVANGGLVPCLDLRPGAALYESCRSGLHGNAALDALRDSTVFYYELSPVALIVFSPIAAALLVPSLIWVLSMRLFKRLVYHRSV